MGTDISRDGQLLVVAGEPSGDRAAAAVIRCLRRTGIGDILGVGGPEMVEEGASMLGRVDGMAAIGLKGVARGLGGWLNLWADIRREVASRGPRFALLVDSPELNLPLARVLTEAGLKVYYYVGPQVWAWRPGRLALLKARVEHVGLVLPFEKPLYDRAGIPASYVGHPVLDERPAAPAADVRGRFHVAGDTPLVALLPGSRKSEIKAHGPAMIEAGLRLLKTNGACPVFAPAGELAEGALIDRARSVGCALLPPDLSARDLLGACDAALVTSGTATLEAAVEGAPMAIVYRLGRLSWTVARRLVKVSHVGLPNLVAERQIVPELLQDQVTGEKLAAAAGELLSPSIREAQRRDLASVRDRLGVGGAAVRVADGVVEMMSSSSG